MSVENVDLKIISSINTFLIGFEYREDLLLALAKGLVAVYLDPLKTIEYNYGHLALARIAYFEEKDPTLVKYGILWDIANVCCKRFNCHDKPSTVFQQLVDFFKLEPIPEADLVTIKCFDTNENLLEHLRESTLEIGLYNIGLNALYHCLKREL